MSMICTSTIGTTRPVAAAPTAHPPMHASLMGVSMTRRAPNSLVKPAVH